MNNERKKSRLIRLLGKLGGKVKFLRKPLMVIAVVCVSIHHLIRQLFFDVKYHTLRMRLVTGAMCLALLCTLFVIPAIADEVFEVGTVVEEIEAEPTETPYEEAPIIEEEPEEPTANQDSQEVIYDDDDSDYDNTEESSDTSNDNTSDDANADNDKTYDVDDEGNLIDPETGETVKNETIAARRVRVRPDEPTSVTVTFEGNNGSTSMFPNTASGELKAKAIMGTNVTSGQVRFKWYIQKDSESIESLTQEVTADVVKSTEGGVDTYYASTSLPVASVVNRTSPVIDDATIGYKGAGVYKFRCDAYVVGPSGEQNSPIKESDTNTSVTINKFLIKKEDVTIPALIRDQNDLHVTVGGIELSEPALKDELKKYSTALAGKWKYVLKKGNTFTEYPAGTKAKLGEGSYTIFLKLDATASECELDVNGDGRMETDKYFRVNYYGDVSSDGTKHCTHTRPADASQFIKYTPTNPNTSTWYNSVTVEPANGYKFVTENGVDAAVCNSQKIEMSDGKKETVYVAKDGKDIIDLAIETDQFQIDKKPVKDASGTITDHKGAPEVESIVFDDYASTTDTWTNKDIKFTIKATDKAAVTGDFGKSGLKKIEWKAAKVGLNETGVDADKFASAPSNLGNGSKEDYNGSDETNGWTNTITVNKDATDAYAVIVYVKVTDNAGNEGFLKKKFDLVDVKAPKMTSTTNTALNTYLGRTTSFENGEDKADDITVYRVSEDADMVIHVTDDNLREVKKDGTGISISTDGKSADITIAASDTAGTYNLIAEDKAGNKTIRKIKVIDVTMTTDPTTIDLGEVQYGYETAQAGDSNWVTNPNNYKEKNDSANGDKVKIVGLKVALGGTYDTNQNIGVKLDVDKVEILPGAGSTGAFEAWAGEGSESGTVYVRPKASAESGKSLDVGEYTAILKVSYDFDVADADDKAVVIGKHTHSMGTSDPTTLVVSDGLKFTVKPTPIYMEYEGSQEYYHTRPGDGQDDVTKQRWFDRLKIARGLRYGEAESVVKTGENGGTFVGDPYKPDYTVAGTGLTEDYYLIGDCDLTFTITGGENKLASKNYYYASTDASYTVTGEATVVRRDNKATGTVFAKGTAYTIEGDQVEGRPDSRDWYTSNVSIKPKSGYSVKDAGDGTYDAKSDTETHGTNYAKYNVPATSNTWTNVTGAFNSSGSQDLSAESDDQIGQVKYFYLIKDDTGEVSDMIKEIVLIDKTAPGQEWDPSGNANAGEAVTKGDDHIPYFFIELNAWRKFFNDITFDLFFNDTMKITLGNAQDEMATDSNGKQFFAGDYQSRILKKEFVICPENCGNDPTKIEAIIAANKDKNNRLSNWRDLSNPNITEQEENGYIYVKLTNGAGLSSYYSTQGQMVIFDSNGPSIEANYDGQDEVDLHEFDDETEFIAESVHFKVSDNIGLFEGERDKNNNLVSDQITVKIYEGKDTTKTPYKTFTYDSSSPKVQEFDLPCHNPAGEPGYTIKAKDNSGFVTTRYIKIRKPVYDIKINQVSLETRTYGYNSAPEQSIVWQTTGDKANADVRKLYVKDNDPLNADFLEFFDVETKVWTENGHTISGLLVKPKVRKANGERLHYKAYTKVLYVRYKNTADVDNGETVMPCTCVFRVSKKKLTATFKGKSVKLGANITIDPKTDIDVKGFITDENGNQEEGRETSTDGTIKKASGYVDPTVIVPANVSSTTLIKPSGGKADDYEFDYVDGVLQIGVDKATKGTHYIVTPSSPNDMGWYTTDITIKPADEKKYELTSDALGLVPYKNNILINEDNPDGVQKFYVKDKTTGQMFEQSTFSYRRDTVAPVIEGVTDGLTYKANKKTITVKDDNLSIVSVNGTRMPKATFDIVCDQTKKMFFIVAQDMAGHITTTQVTLMQESGSDDGLEDDPYYNPDDDEIQDDTGGDGNDGDLGSFTKKVQLVDGAPSTTFTSTNKELKNYVLNSSERTVIKEGSDANVVLRVQNIDGSVSQADKELVIAALGDYTVAKYLDITLWKTVGSGDKKQVTSTKKPISVTITIPSGVRKTMKKKKVRQFAIVRVHDGSASVLEDEDGSPNTITVSSGKFSVYALAYRDVDASSASSGSSGGSGGSESGNGSSSKSSNGGSSGGSGGSGGGGGYGSVRRRGVSVETDGIIDGSPQTGDRAPILPTALGFGLSFIGMITVVVLKKKLDYEYVYVDEAGNYYDKRGNLVDSNDYEEID